MAISKVLVVDDSPAELNNIKAIVSETGVAVVTASNGRDALNVAKTEKPDVIFLDVVMPEMDGFATCRELRGDAATRGIPVIFVTSKDQKADRLWAEMQGARAYITKPYQPDEIVDQLKAL